MLQKTSWNQADNSGKFSNTFLGPVIISVIIYRSFLPVLAWKTMEKPNEKFPRIAKI